MKEGRRLAAIVLLCLAGFAMVALADALESWWPLFGAAIPYAVVPWLIVRHARGAAEAESASVGS